MKITFEVGDVVVLNSGGPLMTITHIEDNKAGLVYFPLACNGCYADEMKFIAGVNADCLKLVD